MSSSSRTPWFAPSDSDIWYRAHANLPSGPPEVRSWPIGTRAVQVHDGIELENSQIEILRFNPQGTCPSSRFVGDPTAATYSVAYGVGSGERDEGVMECDDIHDPAQWRRVDRPVLDESGRKRCNNCSKTGMSFKRCGPCKSARYCCRDCQRKNWTIHKPECLRAQGHPVPPDVAQNAKNARRQMEQSENVRALLDLAGDNDIASAPRIDGITVVGGGNLFPFNEDFFRMSAEHALEECLVEFESVDYSQADERLRIARSICEGSIRVLFLLAVGSGGSVRWMNDKPFRAAIIHLAKTGGSVFIQGEGPAAELILHDWFGKKWKSTEYSRFDMTFNDTWSGDVAAFRSHRLAPLDTEGYYMKTVALTNVPRDERVFCEDEATMLAAGSFGAGWVGFIGDINAIEKPTTRAMAILAHMAHSSTREP